MFQHAPQCLNAVIVISLFRRWRLISLHIIYVHWINWVSYGVCGSHDCLFLSHCGFLLLEPLRQENEQGPIFSLQSKIGQQTKWGMLKENQKHSCHARGSDVCKLTADQRSDFTWYIWFSTTTERESKEIMFCFYTWAVLAKVVMPLFNLRSILLSDKCVKVMSIWKWYTALICYVLSYRHVWSRHTECVKKQLKPVLIMSTI